MSSQAINERISPEERWRSECPTGSFVERFTGSCASHSSAYRRIFAYSYTVSVGDSSISSSSVGVILSVMIPLDCKTDKGICHSFPLFVAPGNSPAAALLRQLLSDVPVLAAISGGVKY